MHICFVDESGTPAKPGRTVPRYFVFGGLVIPEERWHGVRNKLIGLKSMLKYRGEVKWRYFAPRNKDSNNPMLDWEIDQKEYFRRAVFKIITETKSLRIIAGVGDAKLAYELGHVNHQEDIYFGTCKVVTERFQYFLQDISRASGRDISGIIVADQRSGAQDQKMRERHERLVREANKNTSTYTSFIESIFFSPSHMSVGIQLADMVAGAIWRYHEHSDSTWLDLIRPAFRTDPCGKIDGFGMARFPKRGWTGPIVN
ncbi:MAG: DUF3800 domain-containing protein [Alphaproteobacteria bacterium]|nr:DUF3800 domain-containing protein [Alphaproteobacteria bacterium]